MNKITFTSGPGTQDILLNGKVIGTIGSGSEVWVSLNGETIARFKYRSPKTVAKYTLRELFKHRTAEEIIEAYKAGAPLGRQLEQLGIPSYWATKLKVLS